MSSRTGFNWAPLVVVVVVAANLAPSPFATLWPDTVRDLTKALALARGEALPLVGPSINFGPHLGPVSLWIQALGLWLAPSMAAASVFSAAVASLKFAFYFGLGHALSGARLGACIAAAAAIPSIAVYQWNVFFHPNWVEAGIAASLMLLAMALRRGSVAWVHGASAALGLAIQHHPTALFYYPLVVLALLMLKLRGARLAAHVALSLLLVAAWFTPLLFAPEIAQQAGVEDGLARIGSAISSFSLAETVTVLKTAYWSVPLAIGDTYASAVGVPKWLWIALLGLAAAGCAYGAGATVLDRGVARHAYLGGCALLFAGWIIAAAMRQYTSFYACYFLLPLFAVLAGVGLERTVAAGARGVRRLGHAAVAAIVFLTVTAAAGACQVGMGTRIESRLPGLGDLKHPAAGTVSATLVTAASRDAAARHACAQARGTTFHGELAYALAASTNLDFQIHCPARVAEMSLFGPPGDRIAQTAIAGVDAARLGAVPSTRLVGLAAFAVKHAVHPPLARAIEKESYYFERLHDRQPMTRVTLDFVTAPGDSVMVYRLKPFDSRWTGYSVSRGGNVVPPTASTYNSEMYSTGPSAGQWRIEFETDAPQWVDVHVF